MSSTHTPRELAELLVRRLNLAANDLGLTLRGRPLFALVVMSSVPVDEDDPDAIEVFDIELTAEEFEDYNRLADVLEKLAQTLADHHQRNGTLSHAFGQGATEADPNQGRLFEPESLNPA
jgi:hypothetical protein